MSITRLLLWRRKRVPYFRSKNGNPFLAFFLVFEVRFFFEAQYRSSGSWYEEEKGFHILGQKTATLFWSFFGFSRSDFFWSAMSIIRLLLRERKRVPYFRSTGVHICCQKMAEQLPGELPELWVIGRKLFKGLGREHVLPGWTSEKKDKYEAAAIAISHRTLCVSTMPVASWHASCLDPFKDILNPKGGNFASYTGKDWQWYGVQSAAGFPGRFFPKSAMYIQTWFLSTLCMWKKFWSFAYQAAIHT